ncbi:MAG TPA: hypothetical protein VJ583_03175, partial [Nitrososphaeraceae archaeon]|nr:hypothetical protein [Nitrososphaeraceae archaeon]
HYQSQLLQDRRNRIFILIGMDTIRDIGIQIKAHTSQILIPNPHYQAPLEKTCGNGLSRLINTSKLGV